MDRINEQEYRFIRRQHRYPATAFAQTLRGIAGDPEEARDPRLNARSWADSARMATEQAVEVTCGQVSRRGLEAARRMSWGLLK